MLQVYRIIKQHKTGGLKEHQPNFNVSHSSQEVIDEAEKVDSKGLWYHGRESESDLMGIDEF